MEHLSAFLQDRWYLVVGAIVVLYIVVKMIKTVVKWVIVLALLAGLVFYGLSYKDKIQETLSQGISQTVKDQATKALVNEAKDATYKKNDDGSYTVSTKNIHIEGKPGSNDVKVTFLGQSFTIKVDETVQAFIDQAKKNQ